MNPAQEKVDPKEKRQYTRLQSNFPVEFTIVRFQGDLPGLDWQKASTCNVSKEGLCLETMNISESTIKFLARQNIYLDIRIRTSLVQPPIKAVGEVAWYNKKEGEEGRYTIGLKFRSIVASDLDQLLGRARLFTVLSKTVIIICVSLFVVLIAIAFFYR